MLIHFSRLDHLHGREGLQVCGAYRFHPLREGHSLARTDVRLFPIDVPPSQALVLFFLEQRQASGNGSLQRVRMTLLFD
jgi:hypothetical protein